METIRTRGLLPDDDRTFSPAMRKKLLTAQCEVRYLLDRGYPLKSAVIFVANHHQLSSRHMLALGRTTSSSVDLRNRLSKRLEAEDMAGKAIHIDGLNIIITLEVALSGGMLFGAQDGTIRDLAELRGTYRLIPQTGMAISLLRDACIALDVSKVLVLLDAPVSNSGRLKTAFHEHTWPMPLSVELVRNPDTDLKARGQVASGDSIILDHCISWFNMVSWILETRGLLAEYPRFVLLDGGQEG